MIAITRFNHKTWQENSNYREKHNNSGCIYGCSLAINSTIPPDTIIYVLEMNNSINKIVGIGMITPRSYVRKHKMYKDPHYNRYSYEGKYRISINDCTDEIIEILEDLEKVIFYTKGHIKRGQGIQCLPINAYRICEDRCETHNNGLYDYINEVFIYKKRELNSNGDKDD